MSHLVIKGIKTVARKSRNNTNPKKFVYLQLFYNKKYQECWTTPHCSMGHNSWTEYQNNDDILDCGFIDTPMTMTEIRMRIERVVEQHQLWGKERKGE